MSLTKRDRIVIDLALQVLRGAMARAPKERVDTVEVQLALRCLLPHCPEVWPLTGFWKGGGGDNDIGRGASCTASYNGICRQLRAAGRYPE